jgi:DNA mismatch endonuclease (patch repair protein)
VPPERGAEQLGGVRVSTGRPYRPRTPEAVSRNMAAIRQRENRGEVMLRLALHRMGLRYRKYVRGLPGSPDIVFSSARVAVFVDGDFWHGRKIVESGPEAFRASLATERREWWVTKITRNVDRDRRVAAQLSSEGWTVVRVWESDIRADVIQVAGRVAGLVRAARGG